SLNRFPSPKSWQDLASQFGINEVWLVDDKRLDRSYIDHVHQVIHINARCEYWRNYIIFGAQSPKNHDYYHFFMSLVTVHKGTVEVPL
ncbi:MAG: hypothetical protein PWQ59_1361, partial [Thermoanaerobacterium sp.]|nr:hypothetical protein [Thermoanaerobacterium sp.]